jgi:hypothetical protein
MPSAIPLLVLSNIARSADYTGDGIDDLVVGIPYEQDIRGVHEAGAIEVIRGSSTGLTADGDAFIHQNTPGVVGRNDEVERFGYALGGGDFDGDGKDEVIVGAPWERILGLQCGGIWTLELGATPGALSVVGSESFSRRTPGVPGNPEEFEAFGYSVAVADFDGDGYDDVVVGASQQDGAATNTGAIQYLRGSPTGLTTTGQIAYDQDTVDVEGSAESGDYFGTTLTAGDFDADGYADLAIGIPYEDWSGIYEGAVQVMYGSASGPSVVSPDDELWTAGGGGIAGTLQSASYCGYALTVGDFDGDGFDDLAVGCNGYSEGGGAIDGAGAVLFVYGSATGLDDSELWTQDTPGVTGSAEPDDGFGSALTAGDYDGDGYDDVAIGAPRESYGAFGANGVVHVLYGSSSGVTDANDVLLAQDSGSLVYGTPHDGEHWGASLTTGDYNGDGVDDLVVGSSLDDDPGLAQAGLINVFYGSLFGPSTASDQWFHQDTPGIADYAEASDWFGYSLR